MPPAGERGQLWEKQMPWPVALPFRWASERFVIPASIQAFPGWLIFPRFPSTAAQMKVYTKNSRKPWVQTASFSVPQAANLSFW